MTELERLHRQVENLATAVTLQAARIDKLEAEAADMFIKIAVLETNNKECE